MDDTQQSTTLGDILKRSGLLQMAGMQPATAFSGAPPIGVPTPQPQPAQPQQTPGMAGMGVQRPAMIAAPLGMPPSASQQQQTGNDRAKLQQLRDSGSGISQFQHGKPVLDAQGKPVLDLQGNPERSQGHPVLGGILRGLDIAGSVIAPGLAMNIPGTTLHHQMLENQAQGTLSSDQKQLDEEAANANTAAQTREANANAQAKENPPGSIKEEQLLYDRQGNPIGYRDAQGKYYGPNDPSLPPGVKDVLSSAQSKPAKEPSNEFELWHQQNPNGTLQDYQKSIAKPEKANDFEQYYKDYITENHLPDSSHNRLLARQEYARAGQLPQRAPIINVGNQDFQLGEKGRGILDKAEGTYRTAAQSADDLIGFIDMAKAGNKVAAQASPLEGTLAIVTSQGVKRINKTEVENIQGAGSMFDRLMGEVGKLKEGQPLPSNIQNDFQQLAGLLKKNAYKQYRDTFDSATKRYKLSDEKPLNEPGQGQQAGSHVIQLNGKNYRYNGSGPTDDMKNYTEVKQ